MAVVLLLATGEVQGQGEKPKHSIADVMAKAMKGGLTEKVAKGKATAEEKETLIELFEALHQNAPPKGNPEAWKTRTKAMLDAAKKAKDSPESAMALAKLANCMACHSEHKAPKK